MTRKILIPNLDDLLRRYQAGESENALAKEAGVNRWTFRSRLKEAGIEPRSQSEAEAIKWKNMTEAQRLHQVRAAHDAMRGRAVTPEELILRAKQREGKLTYNVHRSEIELGTWLQEAGLTIIHNLAVGPYNCDIGTGPVAVEVWGGGWHPKANEVERTKYILDAGYSILFVNTEQRRFPISRRVTKYVLGLLDATRRNKSLGCQYWMVRGDGELVFMRLNNDDISLVPPFTNSRDPSNGQYVRVLR